MRLNSAVISGSLRWEGAHLENPNGIALLAPDMHVGAIADLNDGFKAEGTVYLNHAQITSRLSFVRAIFSGSAESILDCKHLSTRELVLATAQPPEIAVDLSHARIGLLRDDPGTWPATLFLDGLTYEALSDPGTQNDRMRWLRLDPRGFRPQTYRQLAAVYRGAGRDDDARTTLLAGERHRRNGLAASGKFWGFLQDITVGYGYLPIRAAAWLVALLVVGTVVFSLYPPRAAEPAKAPAFVSFAYTADLIFPAVDFGQQSAFIARGASAWLANSLIVLGVLFVTTIVTAVARILRRS